MPIFDEGDRVYHHYFGNKVFVVKKVIHLGNGKFVYEMENCGLLMCENQLMFA